MPIPNLTFLSKELPQNEMIRIVYINGCTTIESKLVSDIFVISNITTLGNLVIIIAFVENKNYFLVYCSQIDNVEH